MLECRTRGFRYYSDSWFIGGIGSHDAAILDWCDGRKKMKDRKNADAHALKPGARVPTSYREGLFVISAIRPPT